MPTSVLPDDDEQIIADLQRDVRRLRSRLATTSPRGGHDAWTAAASPATTYQLSTIPVLGTCEFAINGHEQREGTDYTVDADTGLVTVLASLVSGDLLVARYLVTDWLVARSAVPEMDQVTDNFNLADNSALGVTSDGKATWHNELGPWEHLTNQAHAPSVTGGTAGNVASIDCGNVGGTLQATLATSKMGIAFWIVDSANYWVALFNGVFQVTAGSLTGIIVYSVTPPTTISVVLSASNITVFQGATNIGSDSGTFPTTTKHGIYASRALAGDLLDDWSWTAP